jgi:hypothetical protein
MNDHSLHLMTKARKAKSPSQYSPLNIEGLSPHMQLSKNMSVIELPKR